MLQATIGYGDAFDAFAFSEHLFSSPEVDVGRWEILDALMIAGVVVVLDVGIDLVSETSGQILIVE